MATITESQTRRAAPIATGTGPLESGHSAIVLLRLIAAAAMLGAALGCAVLLWLAPWPVDALAAAVAAVAWTSWIDSQEPQ
jgi:hypothetical protein